MRLAGFVFLLPTLSGAAPETKPCEEGLIRSKIAGDPFLKNPVALSVDVDGSIYVTETERRKVGDLDIWEVTSWIPDDLSHSAIEEKQAFYHQNVTSKRFKNTHRSKTPTRTTASIGKTSPFHKPRSPRDSPAHRACRRWD